jgi:hypothetical protein
MCKQACRAALAAAVVVLATTSGCVCSHGALPPEAGKDFGDLAGTAPEAGASLAAIRAILEHKPGTPPVPAGAGRRILFAFWRPGQDTAVASGVGASLADAVSAAGGALAQKVPDARDGRLELDVPTRIDGWAADEEREEPLTSVGLEGFFVTRDDGKTAFVLPGEIVQRHLFRDGKTTGVDRGKVRALLAARAGVSDADLDSMRAYRFHADAYVESAVHDGALPLLRGMVVRPSPAQLTPERLVDAVRRGADYLVRVLDAQGRYVYLYHPVDDRDDSQYGLLRHAGTTYAIFEAYEELAVPAYLEKGELALKYLTSRMRDDTPSQGKYILDTGDEEQQKVGGAGLSLVAFAKHAAVTGKRDDLELMRALGRFIMRQQYADGHFRSNADVGAETGKRLKKEVVYYVGEATLGLLRLYALDPQQAYLDAARKSADWVIRERDAYVSEENQEHDHWLSYALNDLYRLTHDDAYLLHAYKIARAIERKQAGADAPAPDLVGTFYNGMTTPGATRLEAYDADIALSRFAGKPEDWLLGPARDVALATLGEQYGVDDDYWLRNPAKAEGGVRESLFVHDVEIDYVQHAMSAWLHLARILRDPAYGKTGVPSQDPVR